MKMFESFLDSIPKNRSSMVEQLELPDDITVSPYLWTDPEESLTVCSDSAVTSSVGDYDLTVSTDSSIPLSRAMTDSDIDYGRYRRYKSRSYSCPWEHLRAALDAFPPGYLASLNSFQNSSCDLTEDCSAVERARPRRYNEELRLKMERFFAEECRVLSPDDPSLLALEDALRAVDLKALEADLDSIIPCLDLPIPSHY